MPLIATRGAASAQGFGEFAQSGPVNYIEDVFSTWLYSGTGSAQTIINNIDLSTKGGLVWGKMRNDSGNHFLQDTVRGTGQSLTTNNTDGNISVSQYITAFNNNGFTLGTNLTVNGSTYTYASWTFREQPKFFDVVTYTGNGSGSRNISHNLGSAPGCIIIKCTSTTSNWMVWHRSISGQDNLYLNSTAGTSGVASDPISVPGFPSSLSTTEFNVSTGTDSCNTNGETYVAYLFAHNAGGFGLTGSDNVISCGSFTTDGSGFGSVTLGYEPQWILMKDIQSSDSFDNWYIIDNMRGFFANGNVNELYANRSNAENANVQRAAPTATGFIPQGLNANKTYIYIAIRRGPMKTPTVGTSVYNAVTWTGNNAARTITGLGFPLDLAITKIRNNGGTSQQSMFFDRLRGSSATSAKRIAATSTNAETDYTAVGTMALMDGFRILDGDSLINDAGIPSTYIGYFMRRAPGFFDEVCYTANSVNGRTINHNLTVAPEFTIFKSRSATSQWYIWHNSFTLSQEIYFNTSAIQSGGIFTSAPTASSIFVSSGNINFSGFTNMVGYLFATVAGVSKVGSYTGTGTLQTVNCGFTTGARFVLIKRTDSTGGWYIYDSARGISSSDDPYFFMNSVADEVTNTNFVDTISSGFQVTAAAPSALNANGGTFIFLAIA